MQLLKSMALLGDACNNKKHHGGPQKAVCVLENELLKKLQSEGHPIQIWNNWRKLAC